MTPKYMLDTNICIYLMKHQPQEVAARFAQYFVGEVVVSAITLAVLEYGVVRSGDKTAQNRHALDLLLEDIPVAPFDAKSAGAYGCVRLASRDRKRDALDKLIAAHAVALDVALITNNEADFVGYHSLSFAETPLDALKDADALIIVTEWKAFKSPDFSIIKARLKNTIIFDGRNLFEPADIKALGFEYYGIGRVA